MGFGWNFFKAQKGPQPHELSCLTKNPHIFGLGLWPIMLFTPWDRLMTHIISRLCRLGLTFLFPLHRTLDLLFFLTSQNKLKAQILLFH